MEYLPNRLTPLYFKIYYKEENYLKIKTAVFKYITPPYSKGWVRRYINILVCYIFIFPYSHILTFSCSKFLIIYYLYNSAYPLSYGFTSFINPASYILILTQYKSSFSTCTILFIRSIIPTPSFISLFLKNFIFKLLIRGILYPNLI